MISFRALEPSDLDILYELENETGIWLYGNGHTPYSRFALEQFILTNQNDLFVDRQLRLVAEQDGEVIGMVDLTDFNPQHSRAEVGIALLSRHRRLGHGSNVLKACIEWIRGTLCLHQLVAMVSVENRGALRAFQNAGFTETGQLKDWISTGTNSWADAVILQYIYK